jgi:hypothetical protein
VCVSCMCADDHQVHSSARIQCTYHDNRTHSSPHTLPTAAAASEDEDEAMDDLESEAESEGSEVRVTAGCFLMVGALVGWLGRLGGWVAARTRESQYHLNTTTPESIHPPPPGRVRQRRRGRRREEEEARRQGQGGRRLCLCVPRLFSTVWDEFRCMQKASFLLID